MILSMTGFGKAEINTLNKKLTIEIKSLNSKQIDMSVRMPSSYREKELSIRKSVGQALNRGKIDVALFVEQTHSELSATINTEVVKAYYSDLKSIANELDNTDDIMSSIMRLPDVLKSKKEEIDDLEWKQIESLLAQAIDAITNYRADEGRILGEDFELRIENIRSSLNQIEAYEKSRIEKIKGNIREKIDELKISVDENRFEQELIYYIEKLDITEEITRLNLHLNYFIEVMQSTSSQGKKLGFICQEIGREINTIGSKSNDATMQQEVVKMKDELEKIKEQILNVL
ncbi:MAG: YicC family protein [Flavobacteriales bacterium]|nr:YicC family protein [Flavobacteriales bacterium]MBL6872357.1 YicC family protein [Flavobacteriales bacterium]